MKNIIALVLSVTFVVACGGRVQSDASGVSVAGDADSALAGSAGENGVAGEDSQGGSEDPASEEGGSAGEAISVAGTPSIAGSVQDPGIGGAVPVAGAPSEGGASEIAGSPSVAGDSNTAGSFAGSGGEAVAGSPSLGGAEEAGSSNVAGSLPESEGGSSSIGGAEEVGGQDCGTVEMAYVSHGEETVQPGAQDVPTYTFSLTARGRNLEVSLMSFHITAVDADQEDTEPYFYGSPDDPASWNFRNIKVKDVSTGQIVAGPLDSPERGPSNAPAQLPFRDSLSLEKDVTRTFVITMDVSETFRSNTENPRFTVFHNGVNAGGVFVMKYPEGFSNPWPAFTVRTPSANLVTQIMASTPASRVVSYSGDVMETVAQYGVWNEGDGIGRIDSVSVWNNLDTGTLKDCARIGVKISDQLCADASTADVQNDVITIQMDPSCDTTIWPTGTRMMEILCQPANPVPSSEATDDDPVSGDVFALQAIAETDDGSAMALANEVPAMTLQ